MLEIKNVHSFYGDAHVLHGIDLTVPEGSVVALLGRNGMGKTSLIRSVMSMTPPLVSEGSIRYGGEELVGKPSYYIAARGLGLVPQGRRVFPSLSVVENLTMAARRAKGARNGRKAWDISRIFDMFPSLAKRQRNRGNQLSGGEQQMLAIARALMTNPDLLIMDEPSEGLAPLLVQQLGDHLRALKEAGLGMFVVEQNLGLALAIADEVYILENGQVAYHGSPAELDADAATKQRYLGV